MAKHRWKVYLLGVLFLSGFVLLSHSQPNLSVKEIVEKNILATGGKEKISQVENYSFKYGSTAYYMAADGVMKITEGKEPIITEVILVDQDKVKRNCFNQITELTGFQKSTYQCLAQLRCGLFTLINFKDQLEFKGLKNFGPKKYYILTTHVDNLKVDFYLDEEEFIVRRIVFQGYNPAIGRYEVNHDIGPYQDIDGLKIPSSWFGSRVGMRGSLNEISDVKMNQTLEKDFFSKLDVNVGKVKIAEGTLHGNIIEFMFRRNMLMIATNWTNEYIQRTGFKTKDKLILQISGENIEIDFYESVPPRDALGPGAKFMVPNRRAENYLIYLRSPEYKQLSEKLDPLLPIQVKRK